MSTRSERRRKKLAAEGAQPKPAKADLRGALAETRSRTARLERGLEVQLEQARLLREQLSGYDIHLNVLTALTDIVDVVDRLAADSERDADSLRVEVRKLSGRLSGALNGVADMELIGTLGEVADPATHKVEAVRDMAGISQDVVIKVVERGIRYRGDVIRPASVIVSSGKETRQ